MKSRYSSNYQNFLARLKAARLDADLTQQQVADALERPQSFVAKFESGERRLDVIEFLDVCHAIGIEPASIIDGLLGSSSVRKANRKRRG